MTSQPSSIKTAMRLPEKTPVKWAVWPLWALYSIITLFTFGLVMGAIQWLVLRQHVRRASVWILANAAGFALTGAAIGVSIDRISDVVALGALPGIVTGLALVLLLRGTAPAH